MKPNIEKARLAPQSYGIATAGNRFGGPSGVWLECRSCQASDVIVGSKAPEWEAVPMADCASVFRRHGWTGDGPCMFDAKCPRCSNG